MVDMGVYEPFDTWVEAGEILVPQLADVIQGGRFANQAALLVNIGQKRFDSGNVGLPQDSPAVFVGGMPKFYLLHLARIFILQGDEIGGRIAALVVDPRRRESSKAGWVGAGDHLFEDSKAATALGRGLSV